jgi:hypothetical protein
MILIATNVGMVTNSLLIRNCLMFAQDGSQSFYLNSFSSIQAENVAILDNVNLSSG